MRNDASSAADMMNTLSPILQNVSTTVSLTDAANGLTEIVVALNDFIDTATEWKDTFMNDYDSLRYVNEQYN